MIVHTSVHISSGDIVVGRITTNGLVVKLGGRNGVDVFVPWKHPKFEEFEAVCERMEVQKETAPGDQTGDGSTSALDNSIAGDHRE